MGSPKALTVLRTMRQRPARRTLAGAIALPGGALPTRARSKQRGVAYQYTSFPARAIPTGERLRVYLLRTIASTAPLCGATTKQTTLQHAQPHRATDLRRRGRPAHARAGAPRAGQPPLLHAVAQRDAEATRTAIEALLNQHIVRLRVSAGGAAVGRRRSVRAGAGDGAAAPARAHDRQLRALDPGR